MGRLTELSGVNFLGAKLHLPLPSDKAIELGKRGESWVAPFTSCCPSIGAASEEGVYPILHDAYPPIASSQHPERSPERRKARMPPRKSPCDSGMWEETLFLAGKVRLEGPHEPSRDAVLRHGRSHTAATRRQCLERLKERNSGRRAIPNRARRTRRLKLRLLFIVYHLMRDGNAPGEVPGFRGGGPRCGL